MNFLSLRSMSLSLRFIIPLAIALALLAYIVIPLVSGLTIKWFARDLDIRSQLVSNTLQESLTGLISTGEQSRITKLLQRATQDERLLAIGVCTNDGKLLYRTTTFPKEISCVPTSPQGHDPQHMLRLLQGPVHVTYSPLEHEGTTLGSLVLVHDMSFVERRSADTQKYIVVLFVVMGVIISFITVFVAHLSWRGWVEGMRAILRGEGIFKPFNQPAGAELQPLVDEMKTMLRSLESERRHADDMTTTWNPPTLRSLLHKQLTGDQVIVVSNREPYIHVNTEEYGIQVHRPASGLVTAVEPVMRACSGTWIAHGSGSGDRETVDRHDRVAVPPEKPEYNLRRIWLTDEEEQGYYYGFANEGFWPLCHNAHVRPIFRSSDWVWYQKINQRFADAVVTESRSDDPVILVQDYHFALLPAMIRSRLPKATIITFWHIPWPNPESFSICPWREELLKGMLGSTILGFHTPFHCKNFLETVDRFLETRIEHESSTIFHKGQLTMVEDYPISIQWPPDYQNQLHSVAKTSYEIRSSHALPADHLLGIGVDRMDYTKGILERLMAVERMLELYPELAERFTFIQIAAPSRSALDDYRSFEQRLHALVNRINDTFSHHTYPTIILKAEHHEPEQVTRYYRASQVCMVTSLHDGMNLVAKEFVAARDDEQGVLVLSQFTGAANELHEALIVNPYHVEQTANALYQALVMPEYEQKERMRSMRAQIRDFNVYRWAGRMLLDAARVRQRERLTARIGGLP